MGNQPKPVTKTVNADSGLSTMVRTVSVLTIPYPLKYWQVEREKEHLHLQGNGGEGGRGEIRVE